MLKLHDVKFTANILKNLMIFIRNVTVNYIVIHFNNNTGKQFTWNEGNVLRNSALIMFYLRLDGIKQKVHMDNERWTHCSYLMGY